MPHDALGQPITPGCFVALSANASSGYCTVGLVTSLSTSKVQIDACTWLEHSSVIVIDEQLKNIDHESDFGKFTLRRVNACEEQYRSQVVHGVREPRRKPARYALFISEPQSGGVSRFARLYSVETSEDILAKNYVFRSALTEVGIPYPTIRMVKFRPGQERYRNYTDPSWQFLAHDNYFLGSLFAFKDTLAKARIANLGLLDYIDQEVPDCELQRILPIVNPR